MVSSVFGVCEPTESILGSAFARLFTLGWWPWTFWDFAIFLVVISIVGFVVVSDPPKGSAFATSLCERRSRALMYLVLSRASGLWDAFPILYRTLKALTVVS